MRYALCLTSLLLISALAGCGRGEPEAKAELEKAAEVMAEAPAPAPEPPAPGQPAPEMAAPQEPTVAPAQEVRQALVEYKAGKLEDAVTRLQKLRATSALTAQQRMALQDSVAAVMSEIYEMAARGDQRAIQAVRQYEEMQTRRR